MELPLPRSYGEQNSGGIPAWINGAAEELGDPALPAHAAADPEYARFLREEAVAQDRVAELRSALGSGALVEKVDVQATIQYRTQKSGARRAYEHFRGYSPPEE